MEDSSSERCAFGLGRRLRETVAADLEALNEDQERRSRGGSVFIQPGECPREPDCPIVDGVCTFCGLRAGLAPETEDYVELARCLRAGVSLDAEALGVDELGVLARVRMYLERVL